MIRTSRWAIWARRFATFALPVLVSSVLLHRANALDSNTFLLLLGLGSALAFFALMSGFIAFGRLWHTGDRGWGRATLAIFLSLICLVPFGYAAFQFINYPMTNVATTDWIEPPQLVTVAGQNQETRAPRRQIADAFPNAVPRIYPVSEQVLFDQALRLVELNGWQISVSQAPRSFGRAGQINATTQTLFGWVDEVSLRVRENQEGAQLDMLSASFVGNHDLGTNGRRIEQFLLQLDDAMNEFILDQQAIQSVTDEQEDSDIVVQGVIN